MKQFGRGRSQIKKYPASKWWCASSPTSKQLWDLPFIPEILQISVGLILRYFVNKPNFFPENILHIINDPNNPFSEQLILISFSTYPDDFWNFVKPFWWLIIHYWRQELSLHGREEISWYCNPCKVRVDYVLCFLSAMYHHYQAILVSEDTRQTISKLYTISTERLLYYTKIFIVSPDGLRL